MFFVASFILVLGCDRGTEDVVSGDNDSVSVATVSLSGILVAPTGDTVSVPPKTDVILYYWLPLDRYDEMASDLLFLASLDDSTCLVLPVQPDFDSRNHAQRVINNMGISLPVYLADSTVMSKIDTDILPFCLFLTPEGEEFSESGFGSPSRLLSSFGSGE